MLNFPILLFCINSVKETGTFDYITKPINNEITINMDLSLKPITPELLSKTFNEIIEWNMGNK